MVPSHLSLLLAVIRIAILKTDNSKYLAISICQAGSVETWAILSADPGGLSPELKAEAKNGIRERGIDVRDHDRSGTTDVEPNNIMKGGRVRITTCSKGAIFTGISEGVKEAGQINDKDD